MNDTLRRIGWLARKDLGNFFADRNGALMTFVMPVLLASLIGMLFAARSKAGKVELLVVDQDGGAATEALIASLDAEAALDVERVSFDEAHARIAQGHAGVALILPRGVSDALRPSHLFIGEPLAASLLYDPSRDIESELVGGLFEKVQMEQAARGFSDASGRRELLQDLRGEASGAWLGLLDEAVALSASPTPADPTAAAKAGGVASSGMRPPLSLAKEAVVAAGPAAGYNSYAHSFAGMLCMFLLFLAQDMAKSLVQERQAGVLVRTRLARVAPIVPLLGLAGSTAVLALILSVGVYAAGILVFGIPVHGGFLALGIMVVAQALFAGGFAVLLAGLGRSEKQLQAFGVAAILVMSFVGGAWYPRFLMPDWLQSVAQALPTSWATDGLAAATWRGLPLADVLLPAAVLAAFAAVFVAVGNWRFRWQE